MSKPGWKSNDLKSIYRQITYLQGHTRHLCGELNAVLTKNRLPYKQQRYVAGLRDALDEKLTYLENTKEQLEAMDNDYI